MKDKYFFKRDEVFVLHDKYLYNLFPSSEQTIGDETLPPLQGNFFLRYSYDFDTPEKTEWYYIVKDKPALLNNETFNIS
jgi:hypothetical protein